MKVFKKFPDFRKFWLEISWFQQFFPLQENRKVHFSRKLHIWSWSNCIVAWRVPCIYSISWQFLEQIQFLYHILLQWIIHIGPNISLSSLCNRLSPPFYCCRFSLMLSKSWMRVWKLVKEPWDFQSLFTFHYQDDFPCTISHRSGKLRGCISQPFTWSSHSRLISCHILAFNDGRLHP